MNTPLNPLDSLRDIHLPEDPGFWPPAIGWWIVGVLSSLVIVSIVVGIWRWYSKALPLKEFRKQILSIPVVGLKSDSDRQSAIFSMSASVKQLCVFLMGRETVASVSGQSLLVLLDKISASTYFSNGPGKIFASGSYQLGAEGDLVELRRGLVEKLGKRCVLRNARKIVSHER